MLTSWAEIQRGIPWLVELVFICLDQLFPPVVFSKPWAKVKGFDRGSHYAKQIVTVREIAKVLPGLYSASVTEG